MKHLQAHQSEALRVGQPLRISVAIATLGRPQSLDACLRALEAQQEPPYEVVVVVDGELAAEVQAVLDACRARARLQLRQLSNGRRMGAPYSKNRGAEATHGDIVAFLDDDITVPPGWTRELRRGYESCPEAAGVGGMIEMDEVYFYNRYYRLFTRLRQRLFRARLGRMDFVGMPYLSLVMPARGLLRVDFLHGGNMSFRREVFMAHRLDARLGVRDEFDICARLTRGEKLALIYNSEAKARHHHVATGGLALWGSARLARDFKDHVPYLLKNYNLKYLRLAAFALAVSAYALLTRQPSYVRAVREGLQQYRALKNAGSDHLATAPAAAAERGETRR